MENPEPTEAEHELAGTERHAEEEEMRGGAQQPQPQPEPEPDDEEAG